MRDAVPPIVDRLYRKLRLLGLHSRYRQYVQGISKDHVLHGVQTRLVGDASADPTEYFDHYDAFASWATRKIFARGGRLRTLDVGSIKMMNGILAGAHDVTSLVLGDCRDTLSGVRYVRHDVSDPLPFPENSFDVFTSMASLPLVGLARYGDRLDPDCLPKFIRELGRVMKPDADLLISMCLGPSVLNFNNGWFLDMPTMRRVFKGWNIVDHLVDIESSPKFSAPNVPAQRFSTDTSVESMSVGDYRVIFLQLQRG